MRDAYAEYSALTEKQRAAVLDACDGISDDDLHERFDTELDELHAPVEVVGLTYSPSDVLRKVDEVAYREAFNSCLDGSEYIDLDGDNYLASDVLEAIDALESDD